MSDFIEIINIAGKKYYFSFRKKSTPLGPIFLVTTLENGEVISFEIRADKFNDWKILDPVPNWIEQIKEKLFEASRNHFKNSL